MTRSTAQRGRRERGFAMVVVLGVLALMLGIGAAIHSAVIGETTLRGAHARGTNGFYAAEAGINRGMGDYRNIFLSYNVPSGADFDPHSFVLGGRTVRYQLALVPPTPTKPNPSQVTIPAGSQFAGLNSTQYLYTVTSNSELTAGDTEVSIGSQFNIDYIPLFQFLAFYQGDLEILPGPNMTLTGPIHTNGSLYVNSNTTCAGNPCVGGLTIRDAQPQMPTVSVSAVGNVYRGRKDDSTCLGTVQIAKLVDSNYDGALDLQTMPCSGQQSSSQLSTWLGAIKAKQSTVTVPSPGILARGAGDYWTRADLRIALDLTTPDPAGLNRVVVLDAGGNVDAAQNARLQAFMLAKPGRIFYSDVPLAGKQGTTGNCATPADDTYCERKSYAPQFLSQNQVYACPGGDLFAFGGCGATVANETLAGGDRTARRGGFYNNREHAWVYMLNVNAHDLLAWNRLQAAGNRFFDPDDTTDGGIVLYLTVGGGGSTGAIPSPRYGVRIFGSPDLDFPAGVADPTGFTAASDQAFYLEGTYNNVGNAIHPKQPAAIMADSVNVISANWSGGTAGWTGVASCRNDCQSRQTLAARPAAATSIYAAFLGGVDVTTAGNYNGGFENYPRFHETWSGLTLFYRGSFVSLGMPTRANGAWCGTGGSSASGCNIYNPPGQRDWNYDVAFQQVENLPPLTPRVVAVQQILFTENFK